MSIPAQELYDKIGAFYVLVQRDSPSPHEVRECADEIISMFKAGGLGERRDELWDTYQACWSEYTERQAARSSVSRQTYNRFFTKIAVVRDAAVAATTPDEAIRARELASELRDELHNAPRLLPRDWRNLRDELDDMNARLTTATERVQNLQRAHAQEAYAEALNAFEYKDSKGTFQVFKESQATIRKCWLSRSSRDYYRDEMQLLFRRFESRWQEQQDAWRERQRGKADEFREKITRTDGFIRHQEECADRCRDQASGARSSEFADRMSSFADEHSQKAADGRQTLEKLQEILKDIERQLDED
jgi:hypothetical protein